MLTNLNYYNISTNIDNVAIHKLNFNIYVSLTTIPSRFLSNEFEQTISNLMNQLILPKKIFISIPTTYRRNFVYDPTHIEKKIRYLTEKYDLIEILRPNDYGPATKLVGLLELKKLNNDDLIIVLDDDMLYSNNLVMTYINAFVLYDTDLCAFDQNYIKKWNPCAITSCNQIYYNNYLGKLYGWLSFCVKYSKLNNMITFYNDITAKFPDVIFHDDLIFTMYYKIYNLRAIGTTIPTFHYNKKLKNDDVDALRNNQISDSKLRLHLESLIMKDYKFVFNNKKNKFVESNELASINTNIKYVTKNIVIKINNSDLASYVFRI